MADPKKPSRPEDQEQLVERHPHHQDPTRLDEERTSDNSTIENGGIGKGDKEDPAMPEDDEPPQKTTR
jgi:hypothetical protein